MSRRARGARGRDPLLALAALLVLVVLPLALAGGGCDLLDPGRRRMRDRLHAQLAGPKSFRRWFKRSRERALVGNRDVAPLVLRFYERRGWHAAWCTSRGPRPEAFQLAEVLDRAAGEGSLPEEPAPDSLRQRLESLESGGLSPRSDPLVLADLDLLLTRAFFKHAAHLHTGLLDPARLPADWHVRPRRADLGRVLERALAAHDLQGALAPLEPAHGGYLRLRDLLGRYRRLARSGGWSAVPPGPPLRRGSGGPRVRLLRARLAAEGDLEAARARGSVVDADVAAAVRRFQARHGLDTTGVVRERDLAELDVPAGARVRQIELNLERWRWLPDTLGERHLLVNIPAFTLEARERGRPVLGMRVVVGREVSRTPMLSDSVTYVVFNPVWEVPPDIASGEVLTSILKEPGYLAKNHLRLYRGRGREAREVDPATVDWKTVTPEAFPFAVKQDPGPDNAVGRVKFMCPNPYAIYLHDTPAGHLFDARERDFSHGCVRVGKPLELVHYLLRGKKGWDSLRIATAWDSLKNLAVILPRPVPVHLLYWTAWVDEQGAPQFRRDVYGLDSLLTDALSRARGRPAPALEWARIRRDSAGRASAGEAGRPAPAATPAAQPSRAGPSSPGR